MSEALVVLNTDGESITRTKNEKKLEIWKKYYIKD